MSESNTILHAIEFPVQRKLTTRKITIHGWCIDVAGGFLHGVRARIGDKTFVGRRKRPRPYLRYRYPGHPEAPTSGFAIEVTLGRGNSEVVLECKKEDKQWYPFARLQLAAPWFLWPWLREEKNRDYLTWVSYYDSTSPEAASAFREAVAGLGNGPLISVLLPVYNTPGACLERAIGSVLAQFYPKWELCVVDDASTMPHVRKILEHYAKKDARIKVCFRESNGHIVGASNTALAMATGEFVALLDHDDELRGHSLLRVVQRLHAHPGTVLVYSDEDHLDENGSRFAPYFKPDFNYDLLLSQNFICHLSVYKTSVVNAVGGFREGTNGAQDWDLALRVLEASSPRDIQHIPEILYHWRNVEGSTASGVEAKPYAAETCRQVVEAHLIRTGTSFDEVRCLPQGHLRVVRSLPNPPPVTIIVPTRNYAHLLRVCLDSVFSRTDYPAFNVLIVDNDSDEPETLELLGALKSSGRVEILKLPGPFNYSVLNNRAVAACRGEVVCLLNNDIEIHERDWLREMVSQAVRPEIGAVGTKLYYPNGRIQHAGVIMGIGGAAGHLFKGLESNDPTPGGRLHLVQNFSALTAACLVVEKRKYLSVGGLDEGEFAISYNDIDFCLKLVAAGYRNLYTPYAEMSHHESASRGAMERSPAGIARSSGEAQRLRIKWQPFCEADPAYNPNLTLLQEDASLAFPPRGKTAAEA